MQQKIKKKTFLNINKKIILKKKEQKHKQKMNKKWTINEQKMNKKVNTKWTINEQNDEQKNEQKMNKKVNTKWTINE